MRILITGGKGQLGSECTNILKGTHDVISLDIEDLDITDSDVVERIVSTEQPDIILNCAAYTLVDACEKERKVAWGVNVDGPGNLARSIDRLGRMIIHISTDYIFDGKREVPEQYIEDDEPKPLSYYGRTKLESELLVRKLCSRSLIVRSAWVYGERGNNFLKTLLGLVLNDPEKRQKVVNDQYGSPTWSYRLAEQLERLIDIGAEGVYHATSEGYCTWYEFACYFLERMGVKYKIAPCRTEEYPTPAIRPKNSILENRRLKKEGINIMPDWREDIDIFVSKYKECLVNEASGVKK